MNTSTGKIISKINKNPFVIGIAGGTGSGKSFYAEELSKDLEGHGYETVLISQDDFAIGRHFKDKNTSKYKFDDPKNYRIEELAKAIKYLKAGKPIVFSAYDLKNHEPTKLKTLKFCTEKPKAILVEGIYAWLGILEAYIDYKIFIDVSPETRFILRTNRNVAQLKVNDLETVTKMFWTNAYYAHKDFVEPMSKSADLIMQPEINLQKILTGQKATLDRIQLSRYK